MLEISREKLLEKLGAFIKVENCPSRNGCGEAPNQFILNYANGEILQSYDSLVGARVYGDRTYYFTSLHDYSKTTSAYVTRWSGLNTAQRRKAIENEKAILITT